MCIESPYINIKILFYFMVLIFKFNFLSIRRVFYDFYHMWLKLWKKKLQF